MCWIHEAAAQDGSSARAVRRLVTNRKPAAAAAQLGGPLAVRAGSPPAVARKERPNTSMVALGLPLAPGRLRPLFGNRGALPSAIPRLERPSRRLIKIPRIVVHANSQRDVSGAATPPFIFSPSRSQRPAAASRRCMLDLCTILHCFPGLNLPSCAAI